MANPASTVDQNLLPVQAYFDLQGNFQTFIGQNKPFFATINPIQSGLIITNSTIDSTIIGANSPSTGVFTNVSATTGQISNSPVNPADIANKLYVDTVAQGLNPKGACKVGTLTNITLSGLQTIDGYAVQAGNRVLVKNQTNTPDNGIYVAASGAWTRATDMDVWSEVPGAYTVVLNGSQADTGWVSTSADTGTIGTTPITWVQFSGVSVYFAGTGLTLNANTFSITNTGVTAGSYGSASQSLSATVNAQGQLTALSAQPIAIANTQVSGLGTMSTQNANNVAITGGSITGTPISGSTVGGTTITASTQFSGPGTGLTGTATSLNIGGNAATATFATSAGSASTATTATTATNLAGGAANSLPYQSAANTTAFLASGTGVLQNNSGLAWTTSPSLVGTNFSSIPNGALVNSSITLGTTSISLGSTATTITGLTLTNPTQSSYETWAAIAQPSYSAGRMWYDSTQDAIGFYDSNTGNDIFLGREVQERAYNQTGSTIAAGSVVYITGQHSQFPTIALAQANSASTANAWGIANTAIANNSYGDVIVLGKYTGLNTSGFNSGDLLYLSATTAGGLTNVMPTGSNYTVPIGYCIYSNPSQGVISITVPLPPQSFSSIFGVATLSQGGTNANLTASAGGVVYSTASALAISSVGTTGQFLQSNGTGAPTWATPVSYATVTDDTTTNATRYPLFANQTSGNLATEYTSSTKLQYNPSTGALSATSFVGTISGSNVSGNISGNAANVTGTVAIANGGTGQTTASAAFNALSPITTTGDLIIGNGANSATRLPIGANTYILTSNGTTATWAAAPQTGITISDDTTTNATRYLTFTSATSGSITTENTSSTKLYYNPSTGQLNATTFAGAGTGLTGTAASLSIGGNAATATSATTANSVTNSITFNNSGTGAASGTAFNGSSAQTISYNTIGAPSTTGANASGTWGISVTGNAGTVTNGVYTTGSYSNPSWITSILGSIVSGNISGNAANVTGVVAVANGGTGLSSTPVNGALDIGNGTGFTRTTLTAGTGISITNASGSITIASNVTPVTSVTGTSPVVSSGGTTPAISLASGYGDTQNPYGSKTANYFLAAPNGSAGAPTFRAIVAADIPTLNQNTTGTASNVTGTVAIANGGTGQTTASAAFNALSPITSTGDLIIGNGTNSATRLPIGTSGYVLTSNGTTASWQASTGGVTSFSAGTTGLTPSSATTGAVTLAGTLNVANGGTGVTTSTGSGSVVLNTSPSLVTPNIGVASATSVTATGNLTGSQIIASNGIIVNNMSIAASYSIPSGYGAHSTGPVTVSSGQTVTVPSGSRWVIL